MPTDLKTVWSSNVKSSLLLDFNTVRQLPCLKVVNSSLPICSVCVTSVSLEGWAVNYKRGDVQLPAMICCLNYTGEVLQTGAEHPGPGRLDVLSKTAPKSRANSIGQCRHRQRPVSDLLLRSSSGSIAR